MFVRFIKVVKFRARKSCHKHVENKVLVVE